MQDISLKELLEAGCHFGHKSDRWHPKAKAFIYQERGGIHIIDLAKTKAGLQKAADFIKNLVKGGGTVLFIGTKRQAAQFVKSEAERVGAPYINRRWIGGFLTNWEQVHKNLEKIRRLTTEQQENAWKKYPKHERVKLGRYLERLKQFYGGVVHLNQPPTAVFVIDIHREQVAVREANKMAVPAIGVVDTNSDPTLVQYVIPANDDAAGSLKFIITYIADAFQEGSKEAEKAKADNLKVESAAKFESKNETNNGKKEVIVVKPPEVNKIIPKELEKSKPAKVKKKRGRPKKIIQLSNNQIIQ